MIVVRIGWWYNVEKIGKKIMESWCEEMGRTILCPHCRSTFDEDILKEKTVSERLINQLNYYRLLYECYNRYVDDGRKRKYEDYLNEANIHFLYSRAFYYEK